MFRVQELTSWTHDQVDSWNLNARPKGQRKFPYHHIYMVFADRVVEADLTNYQTAVESAKAFSAEDFCGLVHDSGGNLSIQTKPGRHMKRATALDLDRAEELCRQMYEFAKREQHRYDTDPVYALSEELLCIDWNHIYSDDGQVYRAGAAHWELVMRLVEKCGDIGAKMLDAARSSANVR